MGYWSILTPGSTETNLITNPSIEYTSAGWTAQGGSISWNNTQHTKGAGSLQIQPTAGVYDGAYTTVTLSGFLGYKIAVDVKGSNGIPYRLYFQTTGGVVKGTPLEFTGDGKWHRYQTSWMTDGAADYRVTVSKNNHASTGAFYIDRAVCSTVSYETRYFDGDSPGCSWLGEPHASQSYQPGTLRDQGYYQDLESLNCYVRWTPGIGMPPVKHYTQDLAILPGALYKGQKIGPRPFTLTFDLVATDWENLHYRRKVIIDLIKDSALPGNQPFILKYMGPDEDEPVLISAVYDDGLGFGELDGFTETVNMACIAYDPMFISEYEGGQVITHDASITTYDYHFARKSGVWSGISTTINNQVRGFAKGAINGLIYFVGLFLNAGGDADADYLAVYNPNTGAVTAIKTGTAPSAIGYCACAHPNGDIIFGGDFLDLGGTSGDRIVRWNGTSFLNMGTGVTAGQAPRSICIGLDGQIYVTGWFSQMGGVANTAYVARWDGSAWYAMGTGLDDVGEAIACNPVDGSIWVTGGFANAGGTACAGIAKWNGTAWSNVGNMTGTYPYGNAISFDKAGNCYVAGHFSGIGGITASRIARYNGSAWEPLGSGLTGDATDTALCMAIDKETNDVYVGGTFDAAGGLDMPNERVAVWNGSSWTWLDFHGASAPWVQAIFIDGKNIYWGTQTATDYTAGAQTTLNNTGTAQTYPKFEFYRTSSSTAVTLKYLKNETTGATIYLNYNLQYKERLTIDFDPGNRRCESSFYGSVWNAILRGSDVANFFLLPGNNVITLFIHDNSTGTGNWRAYWPINYLSADGGAGNP